MLKTGAPASAVPAHEVAQTLSDPSVRILDVRTAAEFESAHIPGSYNLPLDQIQDQRTALKDVDASLVLVCRSGQRARQAETLLRDADVERVQVLDGGVSAWESAGLPLIRGRAHWSLERQVRAVAGALVLVGALGGLFWKRPLTGLAAFVGGGLLFAGVTDFCGMGLLLARLPYNRGASVDGAEVVRQLQSNAQ